MKTLTIVIIALVVLGIGLGLFYNSEDQKIKRCIKNDETPQEDYLPSFENSETVLVGYEGMFISPKSAGCVWEVIK